MALVAGVQSNANGGIVTGNFNGSRNSVADVKIDGTPSTNTNNALFLVTKPPIVELVEEVVVQTSSYSAENGHGVGQVNITTKGGTNQPHGTLIYYFENNVLAANGFMNNFYGYQRAILRFNLYGGTFGGPVILPKIYNGRNRTFFTFGFEGQQTRSFTQSVATVPSAAMRAGNFAGLATIYDPSTTTASGNNYVRTPFPGNIIPSSRIDTIASNILANSYPLPALAGTANNYVNTSPNPATTNGINVRGDHNMSDKSRLTGRFMDQPTTTSSIAVFPGPAGAGLTHITETYIASGNHVYVFRPDLINDFHFGFFRYVNNTTPTGADQNWAGKLGLQNLAPYDFPTVNITGLSGFGGGNYVIRAPGSNYQYSDTVTWIKGRHTLKFGTEYRSLLYGNWSGAPASGTLHLQHPSHSESHGPRRRKRICQFLAGNSDHHQGLRNSTEPGRCDHGTLGILVGFRSG